MKKPSYSAEIEANTTFHNLEVEHTGGNNGSVQRIKRFMSRKKAKGRNNAAGRTGLVRAEDDNMRYGEDEAAKVKLRDISKTVYLSFEEININLFNIPETCDQNFHFSKSVNFGDTVSIVYYSD